MSAYSTISTYSNLVSTLKQKSQKPAPWQRSVKLNNCLQACFIQPELSSLESALSSRRDNGDSVYDSSSCHLFSHWPLTGTFTCEHLYSSKIETDPLGNFQKSLNVRLMFTSSLSLPREILRTGFLPY